MGKSYDNFRINIFFLVVIIAAGLIGYRLFDLSYVQHPFYARTAQAQRDNISNVLARGNIYFTDPTSEEETHSFLGAANKKYPLAYVVPSNIGSDKREETAATLAGILQLDQTQLLTTLSGNQNAMKVLKRRLTNEQVDQVKSLKTKGLGISFETDRFYPGETLAANVLGFLGYGASGRIGQYGVEGFYDEQLFGHKKAPQGNVIPASILQVFKSKKTETDDKVDRPGDVYLTIDKNVQKYAEEALAAVMKKWSAEAGSFIVEDPQTGKIIAMGQFPDFDPNQYTQSPTQSYLNVNTQEVFEPGSTMKPITMAAGLDLKKITPDSTFNDNSGVVNIDGFTIKNFNDKNFGTVTMSQVLEKSINTGAMYVEQLVGNDNFLNYLVNIGFGQRTNIDLPGEVSGDISNLYSGRKINFLTAAFGQGISVTALQMINAYSMIANGGKLMKPYVVDKIIQEGGDEIVTRPEVVGIPITERTATKLKAMLVSVVDNGFDKARIPGYDVAGKTGTAQIPDPHGGYLEKQFIHNFIGFAPAYDAKFVIFIKIVKPQGITFASDSLSSTFRDIANFLIQYYKIPPTRK